jgi:hypothetical protein
MFYQRIKFIFLSITLLIWGDGFSQNWQQLGLGLACQNGYYLWDLGVKNDSSLLMASGAFWTDGDCDSMTACVTWDGQLFTEIAEVSSTINATLAFEFDDNYYSCGLLVHQDNSPQVYNYLNIEVDGIWDTVPSGFEGAAMDYRERDGIIYLAGAFQLCGGIPCGLVCTFDGNQVQPYYTGSQDSDYALSVDFYQDTLFVGGNFTGNDGLFSQGYNKLCKIVNGQLAKVENGFTGGGMGAALANFQDKLYAGGWLRQMGDSIFHSVLYYENGTLHTLPEEPDNLVFAMKAYDGGLYVAGDFHFIGDMPCEHVARWDGEAWTCLCNDTFFIQDSTLCDGQCIKDIEVWNDTLYVAGIFNRIGSTVAKRIAKLDMKLSEAFPSGNNETGCSISLSPNPTSAFVNVGGISSFSNYQITLTDVAGRLVVSQTNLSQIDMRDLNTGLYLLKIDCGNGVVVKRVVKE